MVGNAVIKINASKPSGTNYDEWSVRASARRDKDIAKWHSDGKPTPGPHPDPKAWKKIRPKQDQKIWASFKLVFLNDTFNNKCAYCEGDHTSGYPANVEHYRPKNGVTENRTQIDHPGYFWLAYEWDNLLLACAHCNGRHPSRRGGKEITHDGKLNEFQVRGARVSEPSSDPSKWQQELKGERPLLMNPCLDDPADHMYFLEDGMLYHKTVEGEETIEVCDLNRPALVKERLDWAKRVVRQRINDRLQEVEADKSKAGQPYFAPSEPYSAWLNFYAAVLIKRLPAHSSGP
jgi:uncharacterized protein (TIGR02646 family)